MKKFLQNLTLAFFSILLGLLISEAGLRILGYQSGNPFERLINHYDKYVGYRMIPGHHEDISWLGGVYSVDIKSLGLADDFGFRDDGITEPVYSVFLGDSFVWGYGVNLADSVSEKFEQLSGRDAVNMGMTSWTSPTQYSRLLSKYGAQVNPEYAFIGLFLGNDFGDSTNFSDWELSGVSESYPKWLTVRTRNYSSWTPSIKFRMFLHKNSALFTFIADRINFGLAGGSENSNNTVVLNTDTIDLELNPSQLVPSLGDSGPRQIRLMSKALKEIRTTGERESIKIVVFIIPTKEMVYQSYFPDPEHNAMVDSRYKALLNILNGLNITYVDLLPTFRTVATSGEQLYFKSDGHWTAKGHILAAETLLEYLITNKDL